MGSGYTTNPVIFILQVLFEAYILVVLLRFFLQLTRADFYNPLSQFIVKVTSPVLVPLRRIIPSLAGMDIAALALAWTLKTLELLLVVLISTGSFAPGFALFGAIPGLIELCINIFLYAIIIQAILSWVNSGTYNPAAALLYTLTAPILRPVQRLIPPIGGIDLSPMAAILGLIVLKMLIIPPLNQLLATLLS
ncbi:MAG TPA: YggT family protein [Thiolapillus brandeum]|uniref:YggT family protein n=1 Tax=Thiolapillus brandeum TaxID=1076588 RepID=A0A831K2T7_9GAMM|nr:YggT family protein [Thiolapillus brandeum]